MIKCINVRQAVTACCRLGCKGSCVAVAANADDVAVVQIADQEWPLPHRVPGDQFWEGKSTYFLPLVSLTPQPFPLASIGPLRVPPPIIRCLEYSFSRTGSPRGFVFLRKPRLSPGVKTYYQDQDAADEDGLPVRADPYQVESVYH
jgi:hypothetical protein